MNPLAVIIEAGLMSLVILSPYAFGSVPLWAFAVMELAVLTLLFIWVIKMIREGEIVFPKSKLNISIVLFLCLVIFQLIPVGEGLLSIISPATARFYEASRAALGSSAGFRGLSSTITLNPYATKGELLRMLAYLGAFFLVIGNFSSTVQLKRVIVILVVSGALLSLFALIQYLSWNGLVYWFYKYPKGGNPFGPFINKNNYAGYINMIIPLAACFTIYAKDKGVKFLFAFMALLMTVTVLLSMSRGGVISLLASMVFMAGMLFTVKRGSYRLLALISLAFSILLFLYLLLIGVNPVVERFSTLATGHTYNTNPRWSVWASTFEMIKEYPLFGSGFGTFESVFPRFREINVSFVHWRDAHNDYLQLLSDTGIAGFLIVTSFFVIFFKGVFNSFASEDDEGKSILILGLLGSVVAFLCSILLTFNSHIPASALLFAVILALSVSFSSARASN